MPLQELPQARASFEIHNSPLSENATVGFEFGYNMQEPRRLVIWEAQYGDFINGAQVIIDQFVTSAARSGACSRRWCCCCRTATKARGPEHSSARPERFLQAAADINLRLVNCTTAAQYFHLLRRQAALLEDRSAAAVRADAEEPAAPSAVASTPRELEQGRFQSVIDDAEARAAGEGRQAPRAVQRQGLRRSDQQRAPRRGDRRRHRAASSSSIRSRTTRSARCSSRYPSLRDVVWLQEEPENMGAWEFIRPLLEELIGDRCPLRYIGRAAQLQPVGRVVAPGIN